MDSFSFRKHYIGAVGIKETTNKQMLRSVLGEKPIDRKKLAEFTLKNHLPSDYRPVVWKLLSGITSRFTDSQEFVHNQHVLMYEDLFRTLKTLRLAAPIPYQNSELKSHSNLLGEAFLKLNRNGHVSDTKNPEPEHFFLMWLISEARLARYPETQLNEPESQKYILICQKLHCVTDDYVDMYHLCSTLWSLLRKNGNKIRDSVQSAIGLLKKRNESLHSHLSQIGLFSDTLLEDQSLYLFCEIFPESAIEKLVDKIFAGSFEIMTHLIVELLCHLRDNLCVSTSVESVRNKMYEIRKEQIDIVLSQTLESFHKYGNAVHT